MDNNTIRLAKSSFYTFSASITVILLTTITSIIVTRLLGKENMGLLTILINLQAIVMIFATFGIPPATVKFLAEYNITDKNILDKLISTSFIIIFIFAIVSGSIYFLSANFISNEFYHEQVLFNLILISALTVILLSLLTFINSAMQGIQKIKLMSKLTILNSIVSIPIVLFFVFTYGLIGAAIAALISTIINLIITFSYIRQVLKDKNIQLTLYFDNKIAKKLFNIGLPTLLSGLMVAPAFLFANTTLALKSGFADVGLFGAAYTISSTLMFIPNAIAIPLIPMISELHASNIDEMSRLVSRIYRLVGLIVLPFSVVIGLFSKNIILLLYGQQFYEAWQILFLMTIGVYLMALNSVIGNVLSGTGKMWEGFGLNLIWLIFFIGGSYYLIKFFGLRGLGFAYIISYMIHTFNVYIFINKKLNIRIEKFFGQHVIGAIIFILTYSITANIYEKYSLVLLIFLIILLIFIEYTILTEDERLFISTKIGVKI